MIVCNFCAALPLIWYVHCAISGTIKYVGLSECTPNELRRAHAVHPITAIQMEWSLGSRDIEESVVPAARELGVGKHCACCCDRLIL